MRHHLLPWLFCFAVGSTLRAEDQSGPSGWTLQQPGVPMEPAGDVSTQGPPVPTPPPNWAVAAMLAIDPKYTNGIVLVTGRGGTPEPKQWVVVARDSDDLGTLHKLTVANGQVIADVLSMNAYESFRQDVAIAPPSVQVDSGDAFLIAQPIAAANGKIIGHVDYALTVRGTDATPIWTLNCFDLDNRFLGKIVMLASDGTILSQQGFPKSSP